MDGFDIVLLHGRPSLYRHGVGLLRDFSLSMSLSHGGELPLPLREVKRAGNRIVLDYSLLPFGKALLIFEERGEAIVARIEGELSSFSKAFSSYLGQKRTVVITYFPFDEASEVSALRFDEERLILSTSFPPSLREAKGDAERVLFRHGGGITGIECLPGPLDVRLSKNEIAVDCLGERQTAIEGDVFAVARGHTLRETVAILEKSIGREAPFPIRPPSYRLAYSPFEYFGDGYGKAEILARVDEFISNGIKPDCVLLRGEWFKTSGGAAYDFEADPERFPGGLAELVRELAERSVSLHVRVPLAGGRFFYARDGEIGSSFSGCFISLPGGSLLPRPEAAPLREFFSSVFSFLASKGIRGLEVEGLSLLSKHYGGLFTNDVLAERYLGAIGESLGFFGEGSAFASSLGNESRAIASLPLVYDGINAMTREEGFEESLSSFVLSSLSLKGHPIVGPSVVPLGKDAMEAMAFSLLLDSPLVVSGPAMKGDVPFIKAFMKNGRPYRAASGIPVLEESSSFSNPILENRVAKILSPYPGGYLFAAFSKCLTPLRRELSLSDFGIDGEYLALPSFGGQGSFLTAETPLTFEVRKGKPAFYELIRLEDGSCPLSEGPSLLRFDPTAKRKRFLR